MPKQATTSPIPMPSPDDEVVDALVAMLAAEVVCRMSQSGSVQNPKPINNASPKPARAGHALMNRKANGTIKE
jgi:hypothetical protein